MSAELAIGFDFDHTLGTDNGLEIAALDDLAAKRGRTLDRVDGRYAVIVDEELDAFRTGRIDLETMIARFLDRVGATPGPSDAQEFRATCFALVPQRVRQLDGARELIAELDRHAIPHAILTNGWSPLQERKIAHALEYRGPILVSEAIGIRKPDPAAFGLLVDALAMSRDAVWYVGDNPKTDILGATSAGLRSVWLAEDGASYPADAPEPTLSIAHLRDLLDALRGAVA